MAARADVRIPDGLARLTVEEAIGDLAVLPDAPVVQIVSTSRSAVASVRRFRSVSDLVGWLVEVAGGLVGRSIDPDVSLATQGFDSLRAIQLGNAMHAAGLVVDMARLQSGPTLQRLGEEAYVAVDSPQASASPHVESVEEGGVQPLPPLSPVVSHLGAAAAGAFTAGGFAWLVWRVLGG